jgi:hypothetical protein
MLGLDGQAGTQETASCEAESACELTPEMIRAGARALDDILWKMDPQNKPIPLPMLELALTSVWEAMKKARK